jgi:hypothetical protein
VEAVRFRQNILVVAFLLWTGIGGVMRYILAWALGVPFSVVALWYIVAHAGC